jgi:hypothetical protein
MENSYLNLPVDDDDSLLQLHGLLAGPAGWACWLGDFCEPSHRHVTTAKTKSIYLTNLTC